MLRTTCRALAVAAAAATIAVTTGGGARAAADDYTCTLHLVGGPTPSMDLVAAETYGSAVVQAVATCTSLDGGSEPATLSVWVEYQTYPGGGDMGYPGCSRSTTGSAISGVLVLTSGPIVCSTPRYGPSAGYRVHAALTYYGRTYHTYWSPALAR